jgi:hypothetical protein
LLFRILHALENCRSGLCLQIWLAEWLDCCPSWQYVPYVSWLKIIGRVLSLWKLYELCPYCDGSTQ